MSREQTTLNYEVNFITIAGLGTTAKFVDYEGKQWHSNCFCCSVCTRNLAGEGFLLKNSKIMCGKCGC